MIKINKMCSRIDTIQTKENASNREIFDIEVKGVEDIGLNKKGELTTKWNPNNARFHYSNVYKLSHTKEKLVELMELATVINVEEVKINRIDIATDSKMDFVENAKLIYLLHKCLVAKIKGGKCWNNEDDNDYNYSSFRFVNRDWRIEFYDKNKESEGKSLYNTRLEVRHLRVKSQDLVYHIDKTIDLWNGALNNLEVVEKVQVEKLCKLWDIEKEKCPNLKFTAFVDRNHTKFLDMNILKGVYKYVGLKGALGGWLRDYRKSHIIELVTKAELEKMIKDIVKSLKEYKKL